jgi:HD-GYP domain-containing protein (c-di-GMP phosphodiesterase class II)
MENPAALLEATSPDNPNTHFQTANQALHALAANGKQVQEALHAMQAELEQARTDLAQARAQCGRFQIERDAMQAERDQAQSECRLALSDCEKWKSECGRHLAAMEALSSQLVQENRRNQELRHELLEVYGDLRAEDLPTLITRIGMSLTESECGLFTGPIGEDTVASVGLDDMPEEIKSGLYEFTRRAAHEEDSIEVNNPHELPDGSALVNIACAPVVVRGTLTGVLLVANKRDGIYTDEDMEILLSIGRHAGLALENQRLHCALGDSFRSTVAVLADAIEAKDPYTRGHCENVSNLAVQVAKRLGMDGNALEEMQYAALLHDVGKIGIPDGILLKPGKLLPEEFAVIQKHSAIGSDIVKRVPSLQHIAPIVLHHHERMDGSGYPNGQAGDEISLPARIIGAVDAFDAMTSMRPYRDAMPMEFAVNELRRGAGTHFDTDVVQILTGIVTSSSH